MDPAAKRLDNKSGSFEGLYKPPARPRTSTGGGPPLADDTSQEEEEVTVTSSSADSPVNMERDEPASSPPIPETPRTFINRWHKSEGSSPPSDSIVGILLNLKEVQRKAGMAANSKDLGDKQAGLKEVLEEVKKAREGISKMKVAKGESSSDKMKEFERYLVELIWDTNKNMWLIEESFKDSLDPVTFTDAYIACVRSYYKTPQSMETLIMSYMMKEIARISDVNTLRENDFGTLLIPAYLRSEMGEVVSDILTYIKKRPVSLLPKVSRFKLSDQEFVGSDNFCSYCENCFNKICKLLNDPQKVTENVWQLIRYYHQELTTNPKLLNLANEQVGGLLFLRIITGEMTVKGKSRKEKCFALILQKVVNGTKFNESSSMALANRVIDKISPLYNEFLREVLKRPVVQHHYRMGSRLKEQANNK